MKKILDIIPPTIEEKKDVPEKEERNPPSPKKRLIFIFISLVVIVFSVHFFFSVAKIEIVPKNELVSFNNEITITKEAANEEKEAVERFQATGEVLKKAKGIIKIYNNYSTSPQVLMATTRFVSASGKLFRTPKKITIPGAPGSIDVEVIADQPGEEYNIEPTTFSIPGFAGTPKFTFFYAKSSSSMTGGGKVSQVTQGDIDNAERILLEKLKKEAKDSFANKSDFILLDEAIKQEVVESSSSVEAGTEANEFDYKIKIRSKALIFEKKEIEDSAKNYISQEISADKKLAENSLKINYSLKNINLEKGEMTLALEFSGKIYQDLDVFSLKKDLANKSLQEAPLFLKDQSGITSFQIELWPFWLRRIPKDIEKINIEIKI